MSTRLTFEAPGDLSVGRVTVASADGVLTEWVATPNHRIFETDDIQPGFYSAEVAPVGLRARSYVFEVKPEVANTVTMPLYAVLAAGGDVAAFSGIESGNLQAAVESLQRGRPASTEAPPPPPVTRSEVWSAPARSPESASSRMLSVGLSQDEDMADLGGWTPYADGAPTVELEAGVLNVLIASSPDALKRHPRLRLSMALEGVRTERMMVPAFLGGTRVSFQASPLISADIAVQVTPLDPERRALMRALQAGVAEEASAVYADVLRGGSIARFIDGLEEDAWAAMVATLLTIRFPEVFGPKPPEWGPLLAERYPWASDTHVILARHHLNQAGRGSDREEAARGALTALGIAQRLGAPYFAATNQLMGEMLGGLAGLKGFDATLTELAQTQLDKWRSDVPLQRAAGAIFSWLAADNKLRAQGQIAPYRSTGSMNERYARLLFQGRVDAAGISVSNAAAQTEPPKATMPQEMASGTVAADRIDGSGIALASAGAARSLEAPALERPVTVVDDPNKNRFGGLAEVGGYRLTAAFTETSPEGWVDIQLAVRADRTLPPSFSDAVEFFLHPTFSPSRIKVAFRGHEAAVTVRALGGFTVGAWLPSQGIELECDLALLPDAPQVIREL
ncbi:hypothetical protein QO010_000584 [Caulobacter ginsengisoli]|uniref:Prokaryotic YEATS domain-containing protein n=1 Tax=Caulobacter ginsengisoli TaxID=400775 RepID=A0ABU0ILE9_9CAUL|nr:pYEATS domain-containing protein [Caulobacter ginsengisoli]MDQ0462836.1 hypothetical protein [Caulobacter ginsengisoli]